MPSLPLFSAQQFLELVLRAFTSHDMIDRTLKATPSPIPFQPVPYALVQTSSPNQILVHCASIYVFHLPNSFTLIPYLCETTSQLSPDTNVGGQDAIDIINDAIRRYGGGGRVGAKGVMPCSGTTAGTKVNVLWGIY